jgi:mevalonate kinase
MPKDIATQASAPGRVVLFGEHALDFGEPAVALAVDMRARCSVQMAARFTVDGDELDSWKHAHIRNAVLNGWTDMDKPLAISTGTDIPPELGLGGLAAGTVACLGAISMIHDHIIFEHVARNAFLTHCEAEGGCIPLDTSASTHGGCVAVSQKPFGDTLWSFKGRDRAWHAREIEAPEMQLVLGYSGAPSPAMEMRNKVFRFQQRNSFARDIIKDIGRVAADGQAALVSGNLDEIGRQMNLNNRLLTNLGVGTPALEKLILAASRHSYGAKITGLGGGGCMIALAKEPEKVASVIEAAGGKAFILTISREGLRPED